MLYRDERNKSMNSVVIFASVALHSAQPLCKNAGRGIFYNRNVRHAPSFHISYRKVHHVESGRQLHSPKTPPLPHPLQNPRGGGMCDAVWCWSLISLTVNQGGGEEARAGDVKRTSGDGWDWKSKQMTFSACLLIVRTSDRPCVSMGRWSRTSLGGSCFLISPLSTLSFLFTSPL